MTEGCNRRSSDTSGACDTSGALGTCDIPGTSGPSDTFGTSGTSANLWYWVPGFPKHQEYQKCPRYKKHQKYHNAPEVSQVPEAAEVPEAPEAKVVPPDPEVTTSTLSIRVHGEGKSVRQRTSSLTASPCQRWVKSLDGKQSDQLVSEITIKSFNVMDVSSKLMYEYIASNWQQSIYKS